MYITHFYQAHYCSYKTHVHILPPNESSHSACDAELSKQYLYTYMYIDKEPFSIYLFYITQENMWCL